MFEVLPHFTLLAQADPSVLDAIGQCTSSFFSADSIALNCGAAMSEYVAANWDATWQAKLGQPSAEFIILLNISRYIAFPMVAWWAVMAIRRFFVNGLADGVLEFAVAIFLVFMLYSNTGQPIRQATLAVRSLVNFQNIEALRIANNLEQYEAKIAEVADYENIHQTLTDYRSQCLGLPRNEEVRECLQSAGVRADDAIADFMDQHSDGNGLWSDGLVRWAQVAIKSLLIGSLPAPLTVPIGVFSNPPGNVFIQGLLATINGVVQNLVELAWLLTAIIVPIPLAVALFPGGRGAFISWAVSFLSLGMFKINLNIASALIVSMVYTRGPGDTLADLMLLSIGVIVLAFGMTAGGGLVLLNGISSAISTASLGLLRVSTMGKI